MTIGTSGPDDSIPAQAYQLADHLDAALAAAEDLVASGRRFVPARARGGVERLTQIAAERQVIEHVRAYEAMLIGRVLKARKRAAALVETEDAFSGLARLFIGGTASLVDAVAEMGDTTRADFDTADDMVAYLRRCGVIAADAPGLPEGRDVVIGGDDFLVAGRIALGPLTEMIITFLDALDAHYDLYPGDDGSGLSEEDETDWVDIVRSARSETTDAAAGEPAPPR